MYVSAVHSFTSPLPRPGIDGVLVDIDRASVLPFASKKPGDTTLASFTAGSRGLGGI